MSEKIPASVAMVNVLEAWGVDHLYGIPGGSFNSTMDALYEKQKTIQYIQVRHEEVGALAASADAKLTGKIGVCFGSAGPGGTHLLNGLYDAQMDHVPVLALIGQVASTSMNQFYFQELNENPIYADVSVYNRTVMTPESLPEVVDEAIKQAYEKKGVAVVTIPVDFGEVEIPATFVPNAPHKKGVILPAESSDLSAAYELIQKAQQPVLYIGQGLRGGLETIEKFVEYFSMPVAASVLAKGIIPDLAPYYLGSAARVAWKPANESLGMADLIIFAGSDFPFGKYFFNPKAKFIQIDIAASQFGRRHKTDVTILGDGKTALEKIMEKGPGRTPDKWWEANLKNIANWHEYINKFADRKDVPLRVEPIFKEINRIKEEDAIFVTDVGNSTIYAARFLEMNGHGQQFTTSGWFATMGYGVPGGIGAKLSYPKRQVFTLNGDGAFAMVMQDIITQVAYKLPIINIVFSNNSFGFIEAEQEDTKQTKYGVKLQGADFAKIAEGMGAIGYRVEDPKDLPEIFDLAKKSNCPVVIDCKIKNDRPIPVEHLTLDPEKFSQEEIAAFKERYEAEDLIPLKEFLK